MTNTGASRAPRPPFARRTFLAAPFAVASAGLLAACGGGTGDSADVAWASEAQPNQVVPAEAPVAAAALSRGMFASSTMAVLATEDQVSALAPVAAKSGVPFLVGTGAETIDELARLGVSHVVAAAGTDLSGAGIDAELVEIDPENPSSDDLPDADASRPAPLLSVIVDPADDASATLARTLTGDSGVQVLEIPGADPRANSDTVQAAKDAAGDDPATGVLAIGESFGTAEDLTKKLTTATTVPELPGGGQIVVPHRRMIAAYGSPGIPSLGILGEQDLPASIERITGLAKEYEPFSDLPVIPAFEIITTVASASAGSDGDYSAEIDPAGIREWIDAAAEAGVYVVLDLQPGTSHFLDQAKMYEELLKSPNVGLALDAEWRLKPGQKHLRQIGSVEASEVNEVAAWLAALTRDNNLPQKVFILHQFASSMIKNRDQLDPASSPELAWMLHADGHGTPDLKMGTWRALQKGLPDGIHMAWKNFYDEDTPTFTPEETYAVEPRPWFVSYQ